MTKRLNRSHTDRWIAGVCGGLGAYFGVDSHAVRLAFVLMALWNGSGALLYVLLRLIMPEASPTVPPTEPGLPSPRVPGLEEQRRRVQLLGTMAIFGGLFLLLRNSGFFLLLFQAPGSVTIALAIVLIVGGLVLLLLRPSRL